MRNVFDQYKAAENRLTHALMTALDQDRALLRDFVKAFAPSRPDSKANDIDISVQELPGMPAIIDAEEGSERRGVPDAWLTVADGWCLMIENKVLMAVDADQLARHRHAARRLGFQHPQLLILTVQPYRGPLSGRDRVLAWRHVYRFLLDRAEASVWARWTADYLEVLEAQLINQERLDAGTLTAFNGFPFGDQTPFSTLEAKRLLGLATSALRERLDLHEELGVAPDLGGRKAIKWKNQDTVWDYLQLSGARDEEKFTRWPHFTLGIAATQVEATLTVAHMMKTDKRRRLLALGEDGFRAVVRDVLERMAGLEDRCPGMQPRLRILQQRWPRGLSSAPVLDALIDFDLRTIFDGPWLVKHQPQWLDGIFSALEKKRSNMELQIGAFFPYRTCPAVRTVDILDHIAEAWRACRPLLDKLVDD